MSILTRHICVAALLSVPAFAAMAASPPALAPLVGTWSGAGSVRLESGQSEAVRCKAYYTDKGADVGVALRCASAASKIDLRATLSAASNRVSGTWEERQFNASGSLSGTVAGSRMALDMEGGGLKASVVVATTGSNQTLSITTQTGNFRSVTVALARD